MIRHIVILQFRKDSSKNYLAIIEDARPYLNQIPGIINFSVFKNESKYVPEDVYSVGVEIIFKDKDALNVFMKHPKHYEFNSLFEKYLADPPYMVLTYEVPKLL